MTKRAAIIFVLLKLENGNFENFKVGGGGREGKEGGGILTCDVDMCVGVTYLLPVSVKNYRPLSNNNTCIFV